MQTPQSLLRADILVVPSCFRQFDLVAGVTIPSNASHSHLRLPSLVLVKGFQ
jgi:hypothetical protein